LALGNSRLSRVQLKTLSVGGKRYTTEQTFDRFVTVTTAMTSPRRTQIPLAREASIRAADAELANDGI